MAFSPPKKEGKMKEHHTTSAHFEMDKLEVK